MDRKKIKKSTLACFLVLLYLSACGKNPNQLKRKDNNSNNQQKIDSYSSSSSFKKKKNIVSKSKKFISNANFSEKSSNESPFAKNYDINLGKNTKTTATINLNSEKLPNIKTNTLGNNILPDGLTISSQNPSKEINLQEDNNSEFTGDYKKDAKNILHELKRTYNKCDDYNSFAKICVEALDKILYSDKIGEKHKIQRKNIENFIYEMQKLCQYYFENSEEKIDDFLKEFYNIADKQPTYIPFSDFSGSSLKRCHGNIGIFNINFNDEHEKYILAFRLFQILSNQLEEKEGVLFTLNKMIPENDVTKLFISQKTWKRMECVNECVHVTMKHFPAIEKIIVAKNNEISLPINSSVESDLLKEELNWQILKKVFDENDKTLSLDVFLKRLIDNESITKPIILPINISNNILFEPFILKIGINGEIVILRSSSHVDLNIYEELKNILSANYSSHNAFVVVSESAAGNFHDGNCNAYSNLSILYFLKKVISKLNQTRKVTEEDVQNACNQAFDEIYNNKETFEFNEAKINKVEIIAQLGLLPAWMGITAKLHPNENLAEEEKPNDLNVNLQVNTNSLSSNEIISPLQIQYSENFCLDAISILYNYFPEESVNIKVIFHTKPNLIIKGALNASLLDNYVYKTPNDHKKILKYINFLQKMEDLSKYYIEKLGKENYFNMLIEPITRGAGPIIKKTVNNEEINQQKGSTTIYSIIFQEKDKEEKDEEASIYRSLLILKLQRSIVHRITSISEFFSQWTHRQFTANHVYKSFSKIHTDLIEFNSIVTSNKTWYNMDEVESSFQAQIYFIPVFQTIATLPNFNNYCYIYIKDNSKNYNLNKLISDMKERINLTSFILPIYIFDGTFVEPAIVKVENGNCRYIIRSNSGYSLSSYKFFAGILNEKNNKDIEQKKQYCLKSGTFHDGNCASYSHYIMLHFMKTAISYLDQSQPVNEVQMQEAMLKAFDEIYNKEVKFSKNDCDKVSILAQLGQLHHWMGITAPCDFRKNFWLGIATQNHWNERFPDWRKDFPDILSADK